MILPDSSTVALFANSTIRYPKNFTVNAREIYLCGKAYFDVSKDPSRPFSVYAGVTKTTALGTSFTIDTRMQVFKTAVKLHTGKIVIASTNAKPAFKNVFLALKGESFSYNSKSNRTERVKLVAKQVDKTTVGSSKSMLLNIGSVPLPEVLHALQDAYQVKIKFGSSNLKHIMYTGSIDVENETLEDALTVICLINDLRYVVEKNGSYTIHPQQKYSINKNHK